MLKHGSAKNAYYMVMIPASDDEIAEWKKSLKNVPAVISMDNLKLVPLQLEANAEIGSVDKKLYDPGANGWTSAVNLKQCK
ncbi:MAG: hypothetical protein PHR77_00085 [Kiritimatiellae bacterium]|nr:hypothetical protein [Kiritimatiellia bacterium]MDD5519230.1 hypothetical protein [Kiritimatiellia bacterium]